MHDLQYVKAFLRSVCGDTTDFPTEEAATWFFRRGKGSIFLNWEETRQYRQVLYKLFQHFSRDETISLRTIERILQTAIFEAWKVREDGKKVLSQEIEAATSRLRSSLASKPLPWHCYVPIGGLDKSNLPTQFAGIRFVLFSASQLRRFSHAIRQHTVQSAETLQWASKSLRNSRVWEEPCALVDVSACDMQAAVALARSKVRFVLDILNFFWDLVPENRGWLYLPEEAAGANLVHPIIGENNLWSIPRDWKGPPGPLSIDKLRSHRHLRSSVRKVHQMLRGKTKPSSVEELLLTSLRCAGQASVHPRRELAFLYFMIALESVFLPEHGTELQYRLRLRVGQVLGNTIAERRQALGEIREFYKIRSKIVHDGFYRVTDVDLARLRSLVKRALLRLLSHRGVRRCKTKEDLQKWFDGLALK